jgi:hypothetical protein
MRESASGTLCAALCSLFAAGCDPLRTTLQPVQLQVADATSGHAVADARVWLKYDYGHTVPFSEQTPQDRERWSEMPWYAATTDKEGQAQIGVKYTEIDHTLLPVPPARRDGVSNKPYMIKVRKGHLHEDLSLVMRPGTSGAGKSFRVSILKIKPPRYVKTEWEVTGDPLGENDPGGGPISRPCRRDRSSRATSSSTAHPAWSSR